MTPTSSMAWYQHSGICTTLTFRSLRDAQSQILIKTSLLYPLGKQILKTAPRRPPAARSPARLPGSSHLSAPTTGVNSMTRANPATRGNPMTREDPILLYTLATHILLYDMTTLLYYINLLLICSVPFTLYSNIAYYTFI